MPQVPKAEQVALFPVPSEPLQSPLWWCFGEHLSWGGLDGKGDTSDPLLGPGVPLCGVLTASCGY